MTIEREFKQSADLWWERELEREEKKRFVLQDVRKALPWSNRRARDKLMNILGTWVIDGHWKPEIGENVIRFAERINMVAAERLIENSRDLIGDPEFDFTQYAELVWQAYQRCGKRAGGYFSLSYSKMLKLGIDGQEFFGLVSTARDEGGKIFSAWYAYGLPEIVEVGGDPEEFGIEALRVYDKGGIKILKPYVLNTPEMMNEGFSLQEFADLASKAVEQFGKKTAYWVIRGIPGSIGSNYGPNQFLADTQRLFEERGESAARWYASGLDGLHIAKRKLARQMRRREAWQPKDSADWEYREERLEAFHQEIENLGLGPSGFRRGYLKLLETLGQGGATFYSLSTKFGRDYYWPHIEGLNLIPQSLIEFHGQVSRKVFNAAIWFVPKIERDPLGEIRLLNEIEEVFEKRGEGAAIDSIKYTYGVAKRGGYRFRLEDPILKRKVVALSQEPVVTLSQDSLTEQEWEYFLKYEDEYLEEGINGGFNWRF